MSAPVTDPRRIAYRVAQAFLEVCADDADRLLGWDAVNAILAGQNENDFVRERTLTNDEAQQLVTRTEQ
jgi:hypothetical protein